MVPDEFERLRRLLTSIEAWADAVESGPLTPAERDLLETTRRCCRHCRRDKRKWRSAAVAGRATFKLDQAWCELRRRLVPRWNR